MNQIKKIACDKPLSALLPRQNGRQKPEFRLRLVGICHGIGDFLPKTTGLKSEPSAQTQD
jgi:hypothetical protein